MSQHEPNSTTAPRRPAGNRFSTKQRIIAAAVVLVAVAVGWQVLTIVIRTERSATRVYSEPITVVQLLSASGEVTIDPAPANAPVEVRTSSTYTFRAPSMVQRVDGNRLVLEDSCGGFRIGKCKVDFRIVAPPGVSIEAKTYNAGLTAIGVKGDLRLESNNGRIRVEDVYGRLNLTTINGEIVGTKLQSFEVQSKTGNGELSLDFAASPTNVDAVSVNGSVTVEVPKRDSYKVLADTGNGQTVIDVDTDPEAQRRITAHTDNGDVKVIRS